MNKFAKLNKHFSSSYLSYHFNVLAKCCLKIYLKSRERLLLNSQILQLNGYNSDTHSCIHYNDCSAGEKCTCLSNLMKTTVCTRVVSDANSICQVTILGKDAFAKK